MRFFFKHLRSKLLSPEYSKGSQVASCHKKGSRHTSESSLCSIFDPHLLLARYFYLDRLMPMVIGIDKKLAIQPSLSRDTLGC
jgi:hypothetical protein